MTTWKAVYDDLVLHGQEKAAHIERLKKNPKLEHTVPQARYRLETLRRSVRLVKFILEHEAAIKAQFGDPLSE